MQTKLHLLGITRDRAVCALFRFPLIREVIGPGHLSQPLGRAVIADGYPISLWNLAVQTRKIGNSGILSHKL